MAVMVDKDVVGLDVAVQDNGAAVMQEANRSTDVQTYLPD